MVSDVLWCACAHVSQKLPWGALNKVNTVYPSCKTQFYHVKVGFAGVLITVMTLCFRTDRSGQIVQTQIRLLLEEQSDQGLHC